MAKGKLSEVEEHKITIVKYVYRNSKVISSDTPLIISEKETKNSDSLGLINSIMEKQYYASRPYVRMLFIKLYFITSIN